MSKENDKPQALMLLNDIDAISSRWEVGYKELSDDVMIVSESDLKDLPYNFDSKPKVNSIYFLDPFNDNLYLSVTTDADEIQRHKLNNISQLCGILGASRFTTKQTKNKVQSASHSGGMEVNTLGGGGNASFNKTSDKTDINYYEITNEYHGRKSPNIKKALEFVEKSGLLKDKSILQLIQKRNPKNGGNLLVKEHIIVNLASEVNKALQISAGLNAFAGRLKVKTNFNQSSQISESVTLEIFIEFPLQ